MSGGPRPGHRNRQSGRERPSPRRARAGQARRFWQTSEGHRQGDLGNQAPRRRGTGAEMRTGAEGDRGPGVRGRMSNRPGRSKCASSRPAEPNMRKTRSSAQRSRRRPYRRAPPGAATCRWARSSGRIRQRPAPKSARPSRISASCSGWVSSAQTVPAMASRGSFWPPEMISLTLARHAVRGRPAAICTASAETFGGR